MSILKRMRDMTVATLNEALEQAEDPVRLIDRYLAERRDQIVEAEKLYSNVVRHTAGVRQQYLDALQQKEKREQQAVVALKAGEEEIAKLALQEKLAHEERSEQYRKLYEAGTQTILELEDQLKQLRSDYQQVYDKRAYYQTRMESLRLQRRLNERIGSFGCTTMPRVFDRLEDRLSGLEYEAKSLREIRRLGQEALVTIGTRANAALENELARLRAKLAEGGV